MKTINVKPWGEDQGDFVVINEEDFDPDKHERYDPEGAKKADKAPGIADLRAALTEKGVQIPEGAKKADLQALLDAANTPTQPTE